MILQNHLKALRWKTPFEAICADWTKDPSVFITNPRQLIPGPNTLARELSGELMCLGLAICSRMALHSENGEPIRNRNCDINLFKTNLSDLVDNFANRIKDEIDFVRRAAIRRHEVDRIAERPDQ